MKIWLEANGVCPDEGPQYLIHNLIHNLWLAMPDSIFFGQRKPSPNFSLVAEVAAAIARNPEEVLCRYA